MPKLECFFSRSLIGNVFKQEIDNASLQIFTRNLSIFKRVLRDHEEKLLKLIEKVIGANWEEKDITVYVVPSEIKAPSIPYPLILKIRQNPYLNLYFLTHELCHRFLNRTTSLEPFKEFFGIKEIGLDKHEALTDLVTREIAKRLLGEKKASELKVKEQSIVSSRNIKRCEELVKAFSKKYNLERKSLVDHFKSE